MRQGSNVYYLHADHPSALLRAGLGTASLTTDSGGAVKHQVRHLPFGGERWSSGGDVSDFDFTGQLGTSFGLLDYNARYYDSVLGRFISADSIVPDFANPQDLNRYSYVRNNPVRFTDPTGHYTFEDEPDNSFIWHRDKVMPELVRGASPESLYNREEMQLVTGWDFLKPAAALYGMPVAALAAVGAAEYAGPIVIARVATKGFMIRAGVGGSAGVARDLLGHTLGGGSLGEYDLGRIPGVFIPNAIGSGAFGEVYPKLGNIAYRLGAAGV